MPNAHRCNYGLIKSVMKHLRDYASTTAAFIDDLNLRIVTAFTRPLTSTAVSEIPVAAVEVRRPKGAPKCHLCGLWVAKKDSCVCACGRYQHAKKSKCKKQTKCKYFEEL